MKRNRRGTKRRGRQIQVWDLKRARAALPYLSSVMRSLREHHVAALMHRRNAQRLARKHDRTALVARAEADQAGREARQRFRETLEELEALDTFCLDPLAGQALIPFVQDEQLAWYLFELFDSKPLRYWRFHTDPEETRRPVSEAHSPFHSTDRLV